MSAHLDIRPLGSQGLRVPEQGLGCMGLTAFYEAARSDDARATVNKSLADQVAVLDRALELGCNFFDTAWIYQDFKTGATNESLVGEAVTKHGRDKIIIATKFGILRVGEGGLTPDSTPANIRRQLADSLQRLNTDVIDLYYQHRVDPETPAEIMAAEIKELVREGKIRYFGMSEAAPDEIRRAHSVFPVTAIQQEWSLQTRDLEAELVPTARELGVGIVAYSPLGRGMLTQAIRSRADLAEGDWRLTQPRFSEENLARNAEKARQLDEIAARKGCSTAQLALAWVHSRGTDVFPIPGTRSVGRVAENIRAAAIARDLTADDFAAIEAAVPEAEGDRYSYVTANRSVALSK